MSNSCTVEKLISLYKPYFKAYGSFVKSKNFIINSARDMVEGIADSTLVLDGGYKVLEREEIVKILRESL